MNLLLVCTLISLTIVRSSATVHPVNNSLPYWDGGDRFRHELTLTQGEKLRFFTAWNVHNVFVHCPGGADENAEETFENCDADTVVEKWNPVSCACSNPKSPIFADSCSDVATAEANGQEYAGPDPNAESCDDFCAANPTNCTGGVILYTIDLPFKITGTCYVMCTADVPPPFPALTHCKAGMKLKVKVHKRKPHEKIRKTPFELPFHSGTWGWYQSFNNLVIKKGDSVSFKMDAGAHNILVSIDLSDKVTGELTLAGGCNVPDNFTQNSNTFLFYGGNPGINGFDGVFYGVISEFILPFNNEGIYFVKCGLPGHCELGLGFWVTVESDGDDDDYSS